MLDNKSNIERTTQVSRIENPIDLLAAKVSNVLSAIPGDSQPSNHAVQVRVPVGQMDPVLWLKEQHQEVKLFWESRDGFYFSAAAGIADQVIGGTGDSLSAVKSVLAGKLEKAEGAIRYYGGVRFDRAYPEQNGWAMFGDYSFTLPRFEFRKEGQQYFLCCNVLVATDKPARHKILNEIQNLVFLDQSLSGHLPLPVQRKDTPDENEWHTIIDDALSLIQNGHALEKIVLARKVEFLFTEAFDRFLLLKLLRDATPQCFHFYFQKQNDTAFLGAPPERLYQRDGRAIVSEAVAGTGQRDDQNAVDARLGNALLLSEKDQREHAYVRQSIGQVFDQICSSMSMDTAPSLMNISIGKHLHSRVEGELLQSVSDIDILRRLSPTSAVGGYPSQDALQIIRELESFDRGWYAGPVGWISKDAAEFAVAIRSGLASGEKLTLYSGAGIVDGSMPDAEWNEIEQKLGDFIKALGLDQRSAKY